MCGPIAFHSGPCVPAPPMQPRQSVFSLSWPRQKAPCSLWPLSLRTAPPVPTQQPCPFQACGFWCPGPPWAAAGSLAARRPKFCSPLPCPPVPALPPPITAQVVAVGPPGSCCSGTDTREGVPFCFLDCAEWACHCLYRVWPRFLQPVPPRFPQEREHLPDLQEEDEPQTLSPHLHLMCCELPRRTDSDIPAGPCGLRGFSASNFLSSKDF